jgi:hypothetical protein
MVEAAPEMYKVMEHQVESLEALQEHRKEAVWSVLWPEEWCRLVQEGAGIWLGLRDGAGMVRSALNF